RPPGSPLFPYTTLFRSRRSCRGHLGMVDACLEVAAELGLAAVVEDVGAVELVGEEQKNQRPGSDERAAEPAEDHRASRVASASPGAWERLPSRRAHAVGTGVPGADLPIQCSEQFPTE